MEPQLARGVRMLSNARTGAMWTGKRAAGAGLIDEHFRDHCPCCDQATPEPIEHALLECTAWDEERAEIMGHLASVVSDSDEDFAIPEVARYLLGGVSVMETPNKSFFSSTKEKVSIWPMVARFWSAIADQRNARIWSSAVSRSPNG
jgi:hypothetical protein